MKLFFRTVIRTCIKTVATLIAVALVLTVFILFDNNCCLATLDRPAIQTAHNKSVQWLVDHEEQIGANHSPVLWELLKKSSTLTGNAKLHAIFKRYQARYAKSYRNAPLGYLINGYSKVDFSKADLSPYPYYNLFFMYGFSCDQELKQLAIVDEQRSIGFCNQYYPIAPACKTHQMMGFLYMHAAQCENPESVKQNIDSLAQEISGQLFYDARLVDVHIQRLMMLYESGNDSLVNPRWVERFLSAQALDGGWDNFHPLIKLGEMGSLGVGSKAIDIRKNASNFHATVQGVYLTAMLLHGDDQAQTP